ncbi:unannotated protein [freshwater metagenome]|uniref:Unannotated protein n=1 Tax=freshwater metagenome TaxID=449393 RepID=A0A6J6QXQ8_9ZZZZ|nr:YfhO family protein [Actinomycetota bacterium]
MQVRADSTSLEQSRGHQLLHRWSVAITLAITTLPFLQVLIGRQTAMYEDSLDYNVPNIVNSWHAIKSGHSPFWTPFVYSGFNRLGAGQIGIFYPPNLLFAVLGPVTAYRWWLLAHLWIAAGGAYAWSWHRWRSKPGAIVSGFGYALGGFMVLHIVHMSLLAPAALIPWALLGLDLVIDRWTLPRAALCSGSIALVALSGHPQGLWMCLAALGILGFAELVRSGRGWQPWGRALAGMGLGVGVAAIQLIPVRLLSQTSIRPRLTQEEAFTFASAPRHLLSLFAPRLLGGYSGLHAAAWNETDPTLPVHEVTNYLMITLLAIAAIGFWDNRRDRRTIGLAALAVFGILMSLAGNTPFGRLAFHIVPLASSFRAWSRVSLLTSLAVVSLAAAGVRALLREPARYVLGLLATCVVPLVITVAAPLLWRNHNLFAPGSARVVAMVWPILLLGTLCLVVIAMGTRAPKWAAGALVLVCAVDATAFAFTGQWRSLQVAPSAARQWFSASTEPFGTAIDAPGGVDRWVSSDVTARSWGLVKRRDTVMGYDPLIQRNYSDLAAGMSYSGVIGRGDFWEKGQLSDILRVTTYVGAPDRAPADPSWNGGGTMTGLPYLRRWTRKPRLPESYLVGDAELATTNNIYWLVRDRKNDLRNIVYVEPGMPGTDRAVADLLKRGNAGASSGAMSEYGRGTYEVDATRAALLVVSYAWLDGWHATVDGRSVPVTRANGLVLGVQVPAGHHVVHLRFSPPGLRFGALLSLLSLVLLVVPTAAAVALRRRH